MVRLAFLIAAVLALAPASAQAAGLTATKRVLNREMGRAGASAGAYVVDLDTGRELYASRADVRRMPASVEKLYTTATAMLLYGTEGRLTTTALSTSLPDDSGVLDGDLVLRGGGDPTFGPASVNALADRLVSAGLARVTGRVVGDESAFDPFRGVPSSRYLLTSDVGPLSALAYDHGRTGKRRPYWQSAPARFAANALAKALQKRGVKIGAAAKAGRAVAGMTPLSEWDSPTIADIAHQMLPPSDNYMAETLVKDIGAGFGAEGSTSAGAAVVKATIARFKITPSIVDGSGLSRLDRTSPREVVRLLTGMDEEPAFAGALAVVGRDGTVYNRMRGTAAQDDCHTKTGTLHDVSSLVGYCTALGGHRIAFAFLMNRIQPWYAHGLQDRMTVALARYTGN
jgi:D-alanyl-D-alanine carboxypeptidase/D-alanyl-D-alanine-endopeptidase (penicillin-binding protein 4)